MKVLKKITAFALATIMVLTTSVMAFAIAEFDEEGNIIEATPLPGTNIVPLMIDIGGVSEMHEGNEGIQSFTGIVQEIHIGFNENALILVENEMGQVINFQVAENVYTVGESITIGDTVTAFYRMPEIAITIWPPQYEALLMVTDEIINTMISRFDFTLDGQPTNNLISTDGVLSLNIDADTKIILQDGTEFDGDLEGRLLIVFYALNTFSIPAQTTPSLIVVLFEQAVHPILNLTPEDLAGFENEYEIPVTLPAGPGMFTPPPFPSTLVRPAITAMNITPGHVVVNGTELNNIEWIIINEDWFPTHVPLRAIAEALGANLNWNAATGTISLEGLNGIITFNPGSAAFYVNGTPITLQYAAMIYNDLTFVPISFFRVVFGMNNAYFEGGTVSINNDEIMQ